MMKRLFRRKHKDLPISHNSDSEPTALDSHPTDTSSSKTLTVASFPDGVEVLCDPTDATVDICFIHGLTGNRDSTWTADGQSTPWPKTFLPPELPKARILTYGYDAYIVRKGVAGSNRLIDHATNLLHDLTRDRIKWPTRPLIFVAHSMGGLVCKMAILRSRNNPEVHLRSVFESTTGVIFMGTPHRGAWMADWARIPVSALGLVKSANEMLLDVLQRDNQLLESLQVDFSNMIRERENDGRGIKITCFFEELPYGKFGKVVSKESATFEGRDPITIHANHSQMVKFASSDETGFERLLGELVRWESQIVPNPPVAIHQLSQNCLDCLKSLAFPQMYTRYIEIESAVNGTCQWLLEHPVYGDWAASDRGLLWIKGKPGSGKSTLLKYALENHQSINHPLVLSFFFHGRGDELQKSPLGLFRSLIHQLLSQVPSISSDLVDTFEKRCKEIGEPGEKWQWHYEELHRFFASSLLKALGERPLLLLVDALDECGEENAIRLVKSFKYLLQNSKSQPADRNQFRICFSCRHYPVVDLDTEFQICAEDKNQDDISTFVKGELCVSSDLISSRIPALITQRASGVFMWARLVVKRVLQLDHQGAGLRKIEGEIDRVPKELHNIYRGLLGEMGPASLKLIQWICFATRPLTVDELRWAMVIDADCPYSTLQACQNAEEYVSDTDRMKRQVQTLSCGLAEVISSVEHTNLEQAGPEVYADFESDEDVESTTTNDRGIVQFVHQSVQDFFTEDGISYLYSKPTADAIAMAHFQLSRICIRYLTMKEVGQTESYSKSNFPFLYYATTSWVVHTKRCDDRIPQEDLLEILSWPSNALLELWIDVFNSIDIYNRDCPPVGSQLVHIISRYGMSQLLMVVLQKTEVEIDAKDWHDRMPLSYAAENGHEAVVKLLLATGKVEIDAKDGFDRTPLSYAAENGHEVVVKLLLATGKVEIDVKRGGNGRTPLSYAAGDGHEAVVKILLATGKVDIDTKSRNGRTPLSYAAWRGHEAVVKLLLATGKVDIDAKNDYNGRTALSYAAENGHEAVVKILLATGKVDIDTKDNYNDRTPLLYAAWRGHVAVVKLLLATGEVDVDTKSRNGRTPLSYAAWRGHEAVVKLLLATGKVDIDAKNKYTGRTALSYAAENGHEAVVKLLLATGKVDIDVKRWG